MRVLHMKNFPDKVTERANTACMDHLGNCYQSKKEMYRSYGVDASTVLTRLKNGWTLKDALETPTKRREAVDHLGNRYSSVAEMCRHYEISISQYETRMQHGWSIERALETPVKNTDTQCKDHLGNEYSSFSKMCNAYGKNPATVMGRIKHGWELGDALTKDVDKRKGTRVSSDNKIDYKKEIDGKTWFHDHKGQWYKSLKEMLDYYGVSKDAWDRKVKAGYTLEEILNNADRKAFNVFDHLGNAYESKKKMCEHYGISYDIYLRRVNSGMDLADALETPLGKPSKNCEDPLGNKYESIQKNV